MASDRQADLAKMSPRIEQLENAALELSALGQGVPVVEKNTRTILAAANLLKFGISDVAGREGKTAVLQRGPEFKLLATNTLDDSFDASPVAVDSELYLRGAKYLYRISE